MSLIENAIPSPYRWVLWTGIVAIIAAAGAWAGHKATAAYDQSKIYKAERNAESAQAKIVELGKANGELSASLKAQNEAIFLLQKNAEDRRRIADQAVKKAGEDSAVLRGKAESVIGLKLPPGLDACQAARSAFDAELIDERK